MTKTMVTEPFVSEICVGLCVCVCMCVCVCVVLKSWEIYIIIYNKYRQIHSYIIKPLFY